MRTVGKTELPTDTDFYGVTHHPYVGITSLETPKTAAPFLAAPRSMAHISLRPVAEGEPVGVTYDSTNAENIQAARNAALHLAEAWRRTGIRCKVEQMLPTRDTTQREGDRDRPVRSVHVAQSSAKDDLERALAERGLHVPEHDEGYVIAAGEDTIRIVARTHAGIERACATLASAVQQSPDGSHLVACGDIADAPALAIRFLGGWALWRTDGLRDAIDLTWASKGNRVLYNGWGWIPEDRLGQEERYFTDYARERGIELVYELRRMSFGQDYKIKDTGSRRQILEAYEHAAEAGFRAFGLLFDDVPWETAEDECALALEIYEHLQQCVSTDVEFYCCPQFYWYPGQMNGEWTGHAGKEETSEQREYLKTYGRMLPQQIQIYLANFWGGHPPDYQADLSAKFSELVARKPVFFDNQQINDYRHAAIFPFALQDRPTDFGEHTRGYYLNCARPLCAYAPAAATALAYAWNPESYSPETSMANALLWYYGPSVERAAIVADGINRLRDLANAWAGGAFTAVDHYKTIWQQVKRRGIQRTDVERWQRDLGEIRRCWLGALAVDATDRHPSARAGLLALARDSQRLSRDLQLFEHFFASQDDPQAKRHFATISANIARDALDKVASTLPPTPNTAPLLRRFVDSGEPGDRGRETTDEALTPRNSQGWSWVEYFYTNTRETLHEVRDEMLEALGL